jgi:hypothetical protein
MQMLDNGKKEGKKGDCFVIGVEVNFSSSGGSRKITLGKRLG